MTYSLARQSVTGSASASSSDILQHGRLLLTEPTSIDGPSVALQDPSPSFDATEQRSSLDDGNQDSRLHEHVFRREGEE